MTILTEQEIHSQLEKLGINSGSELPEYVDEYRKYMMCQEQPPVEPGDISSIPDHK